MSTQQNSQINLIFALLITLTVFICLPSFANTTSYASDEDNTARLSTGPVIGNVDVVDMIIEPLSTVTVGWETDVPATSQVEYGKTPDYGFKTTVSKRLTLRHQVQLNDLETDMVYFFRGEIKHYR